MGTVFVLDWLRMSCRNIKGGDFILYDLVPFLILSRFTRVAGGQG